MDHALGRTHRRVQFPSHSLRSCSGAASAAAKPVFVAVRISADMSNVYKGDNFSGYVQTTSNGWRVDMLPTAQDGSGSREGRWGEEAAETLTTRSRSRNARP
jgi:hypothetical protein